MRDRLRLDADRLKAMAAQLEILAGVEAEPSARKIRDLPGGLVLTERSRPVGVIGANFEARPNVVVDIASQLVKSRNAGVLRTGSAALRSAIALADEVIAPALAAAGLDPAAIELIRVPGQAAAYALVREPRLIPLVILRGSGDSTRALAAEGAAHGVRTLAHADGGGVLYIHPSAGRSGGRPADRLQPGPAAASATGSTCSCSTGGCGTPGCRRSPGSWRGSASGSRCRRTTTPSATSGRSTPSARRP